MSRGHKYRIGNRLILAWMHYDQLTLGEFISKSIGKKELSKLTDQELVDLLDRFGSSGKKVKN